VSKIAIMLTVDAVDLAGPERMIFQLHFLDDFDEVLEVILPEVEVNVNKACLVLLRPEFLNEVFESRCKLEREIALL
jgi:hypothetical protein